MKLFSSIAAAAVIGGSISFAIGIDLDRQAFSVEHRQCQYSKGHYKNRKTWRFSCRVMHSGNNGSIAFIDNLDTGERYDEGWLLGSRAGCIYLDTAGAPESICAVGKRYYIDQ